MCVWLGYGDAGDGHDDSGGDGGTCTFRVSFGIKYNGFVRYYRLWCVYLCIFASFLSRSLSFLSHCCCRSDGHSNWILSFLMFIVIVFVLVLVCSFEQHSIHKYSLSLTRAALRSDRDMCAEYFVWLLLLLLLVTFVAILFHWPAHKFMLTQKRLDCPTNQIKWIFLVWFHLFISLCVCILLWP